MIKTAYDLNNFIVLAARLPQIWQNLKVRPGCWVEVHRYTLAAIGWSSEGKAAMLVLLLLQGRSTGQLSVTVYIANAAGCMARIFTSLQEGGGMAMVRGFLLGESHLCSCLHA
jgi:hypothetical protein